MIIYERNKTKGFRGYKYTAKGYIDDKGNPITADTKEGTDMIEIVCEMQYRGKESEALDALKAEVEKKFKEYKPVYKV